MKYIEGIDYWVRRRDFPCTTIFAWAVSLGDGTFDIWLNTRVSEEKQLAGLKHDLKHLEDNHFYRDDLTLAQKEAIAWGTTGFVAQETSEPVPGHKIVPEPTKEPPAPYPPKAPQKVEIATLGQLMRFMVSCENKRQNARSQAKKRVSIDICGER